MGWNMETSEVELTRVSSTWGISSESPPTPIYWDPIFRFSCMYPCTCGYYWTLKCNTNMIRMARDGFMDLRAFYTNKHNDRKVDGEHQEIRARKCIALTFLAVAFALFLSHSLLPSFDFQQSTNCTHAVGAQSSGLLLSPCSVQWRRYTALFLLYKRCRNPATMPAWSGLSILNCLFTSDMISCIVDGFLMSMSAFGTIARAASFRAFKNCVLYWTTWPVLFCWSQTCGTLPSAIDLFTSFK